MNAKRNNDRQILHLKYIQQNRHFQLTNKNRRLCLSFECIPQRASGHCGPHKIAHFT